MDGRGPDVSGRPRRQSDLDLQGLAEAGCSLASRFGRLGFQGGPLGHIPEQSGARRVVLDGADLDAVRQERRFLEQRQGHHLVPQLVIDLAVVCRTLDRVELDTGLAKELVDGGVTEVAPVLGAA